MDERRAVIGRRATTHGALATRRRRVPFCVLFGTAAAAHADGEVPVVSAACSSKEKEPKLVQIKRGKTTPGRV